MIAAVGIPIVLVLLVVQIATGLPEMLGRDAATCGPTVATVAHVTTVTIESFVDYTSFMLHADSDDKNTMAPVSGTEVLPYFPLLIGPSGCPNLSTCGPHAECLLATTETVIVPPSDPCCPTTPTMAVQGPCPTCQKGCETVTTTQYLTQGQDSTSLAERAAAATPCTKVVWRSEPMVLGPTKTVHPLTLTSTVSVACGGCVLLTSNIGGLGPAITFSATITNSTPATTTSWVCT